MTDDAVREVHGVRGSNQQVIAVERDDFVHLDLGSYSSINLTADKAAYLGSKLRRLARRIRERTEEQE